MNYSNIDCQTKLTHSGQAPQLTILVDRAGKRHLVLASEKQPSRRGFRRLSALSAVCMALFANVSASQAQFVISQGTNVFAPSFRDGLNTDANATTYWGWGAGGFDGPTNNERIDLPPVTLGLGGLDGSLNQAPDVRDILSSGNNIYSFTFTSPSNPMSLSLGVPTNGTPGTGFTTIIVQAMTANFGTDTTFPDSAFTFSQIAGVSPTYVVGQNNASPFKLGQFWAKYEIPGNQASYSFDLGLAAEHISIQSLTVDTSWSATSYAPDTAQAVPEPTSALLLGMGSAAAILRRRRNAAC